MQCVCNWLASVTTWPAQIGIDCTRAQQVQREVLKKMKAGELDVVISTSVAEEGLDVAQCQLVLRYDLPSTALAFVQSRGRARAQASSLVLLLEEGNEAHKALVSQVTEYTVLRPRFSTTEVEEMGQLVGYQSTAVMPQNSPVHGP